MSAITENLLAIEGGATHSSVILLKPGAPCEELKFNFGPGNFAILKSQNGLHAFLKLIKTDVEKSLSQDETISKIAIGLPGVLTAQDKEELQSAVYILWPSANSVWAGTDIQVALNCLEDEKSKLGGEWRILVISGTGSVCYGIHEDELGSKQIKVGGFGHIFGDRGSAYDIGLKSLRYEFMELERDGKSAIFNEILRERGSISIEDLAKWSISASKHDIASLSTVTARLWTNFNDATAKKIMNEALDDLVEDFLALIDKAQPLKTNIIKVGFAGSLLTENVLFAEGLRIRITKRLDERGYSYSLFVLMNTVVGGLKQVWKDSRIEQLVSKSRQLFDTKIIASNDEEEKRLRAIVLPVMTSLPTTEQRNPRSIKLDKLDLIDAIELMISEEESTIYNPIRSQAKQIALLIDKTSEAFKNGGRLFYIGAGTSGRLGVLDASECPPTFKVSPEWVQGIIAGGRSAMFKSVENAEDSVVGGTLAIKANSIGSKDVVLGIAASGRTPFVWGALYEASQSGAFTAMLTFNPNLQVKLQTLDLLITINSGAEILTGSTRLKAGTATKIVLNMITTLSVVKCGKVLENLMIDVQASNEKLRDRAARIVVTILGQEQPELTKDASDCALQSHNYDIKKTIASLRKLNVKQ